MTESKALSVIDADVMRGCVLVHLSNGKSILCHAVGIWDARCNLGNFEIPEDLGLSDELFAFPKH